MALTKVLSGLAAGLLFGCGLAISGMTNPNKVLNFLDLTHGWDPSLAVVMAGAVCVSAVAFGVARRRPRPLLEERFAPPAPRAVGASRVFGSALFGVGWGLGVYCPVPAIASLSLAGPVLFGFLAAIHNGLRASGLLAGRLS